MQSDYSRKQLSDVIVIGGGVIGLSIAYELAGQGIHVSVFDQGAMGQESSWAGAGMLPPARSYRGAPADVQLRAASHELWPIWSARLREETGLDNGFRKCGAVELACDDTSARRLSALITSWQDAGIATEQLTKQRAAELEPALGADFCDAYSIPEFCQVRNPRHLKVLVAACHQRGVNLFPGVPAFGWERSGDRILAVQTVKGRFEAGQFVVASGAWSSTLLSALGCHLPLEPIRGQIVLLSTKPDLINRVIEVEKCYLVPRGDGRILIGSTEERVGFLKQNTSQAIAELIDFGRRLVPALGQAAVERFWAGLRPGTADGLPYLGTIPGYENAFVAAGHFREGLHLAPVTAELLSQMMRHEKSTLPWEAFRCDREHAETGKPM
ncbi:MAG: glycine oxidase ThiO [Planctomycetota bacterium]|nr:glycine oxidase ThiO [Planctomycetota bacterium]MDA1214887.1 glycine oxidase ThiO [Planctomycetota bacterium]